MIIHGDCLEVLKGMVSDSVDSIVTDPPYGLAFMGKKWDYDVPSVDIWRECLRVLKPGGHLLAFGGTRTFHRTVVNIENAGFEVRDMIAWIHGQGFPKSLDVSKAIDKEAGAEREVIGVAGKSGSKRNAMPGDFKGGEYMDTAPATDAVKQWAGWGTALKPAIEPICMARKPISEKTVAKNVLKHGCGGLNIDGCRIETTDSLNGGAYCKGTERKRNNYSSSDAVAEASLTRLRKGIGEFEQPTGRFPANLVLSHTVFCTETECVEGCAVKALDEQSGNVSRFFYCAKPSSRERGEGNNHPTVKAIALMRYLCRIITPSGGLVLDPFAGSGSTGIAALAEGFRFVGIEREAQYAEIAKERIANAHP